jgi:hypothetical protein
MVSVVRCRSASFLRSADVVILRLAGLRKQIETSVA